MPQPSQVKIKDDRVLAVFRNESDAATLSTELNGTHHVPTASGQIGRMHGVGFEIPRGHSVAQCLDMLHLEGPARQAVEPHMQRGVVVANTKDALSGLRKVHQHESQHPPEQFVANVSSRTAPREPTGGIV